MKPLTNERLLNEVKEKRKKTREAKKRALLESGDGIRIRGRWIAARAYRIPPPLFNFPRFTHQIQCRTLTLFHPLLGLGFS